MNKVTTFLVCIIACLCFFLGATIQSKAQSKTFIGILPFMTSSDRLGFFDQNTGRVYMYDNNFSDCAFIGQVSVLGQPIQVVHKS